MRWPPVNLPDAVMYVMISGFLAVSSILVGVLVASKAYGTKFVSIIFSGLLWSALITALLGITGYFSLVPGADIFTRHGRAMGAFQDPNVFGPYLLLPVCFLILKFIHGSSTRPLFHALALLVLVAGIFLSFSRAAWFGLILVCLIGFAINFIAEPNPQARRRLLAILGGIGVLFALTLGAILSIDQVSELFAQRAQLVQSYDVGEQGRFFRISGGFQLITQYPLGLGATAFHAQFFAEEPHNMFLKGFTDYGWLGGISYLVLVALTLFIGFRQLFWRAATQIYFQAAYLTFATHIILSFVIDMDHWRHFFVLLGLVWGLIAKSTHERADQPAQSASASG
jgi:O-antigen ligase